MNRSASPPSQLDLALTVLKEQLEELEQKDLLALAAERSRREQAERRKQSGTNGDGASA
jgi:hypothetical protein